MKTRVQQKPCLQVCAKIQFFLVSTCFFFLPKRTPLWLCGGACLSMEEAGKGRARIR